MSDASGSEMSTSVNSDASYDIDIVRHHDGGCDYLKSSNILQIWAAHKNIRSACSFFKKVLLSVATSTANLLDASDTDSESECEDEISRYGKQKNVR